MGLGSFLKKAVSVAAPIVGGAFGGPLGAAAGNAIGSAIGGSIDQQNSLQMANMDADLQREFAQNGVRWKVADAQAAGIHPLYALGAQTHTASPVYAGSTTNYAQSLASHGQDISRAIQSTQTGGERVQDKMNALTLERGELENQLLRSQIARINQSPTPPTPSGMLGQSGQMINDLPLERVVADPNDNSKEVGDISDYSFVRTAGGGLAPVPSADAKQRIEDTFIPQAMWSLRNNIVPNFRPYPFKNVHKVPDGYRWDWTTQDYRKKY